jgi:hypothetical protein
MSLDKAFKQILPKCNMIPRVTLIMAPTIHFNYRRVFLTLKFCVKSCRFLFLLCCRQSSFNPGNAVWILITFSLWQVIRSHVLLMKGAWSEFYLAMLRTSGYFLSRYSTAWSLDVSLCSPSYHTCPFRLWNYWKRLVAHKLCGSAVWLKLGCTDLHLSSGETRTS